MSFLSPITNLFLRKKAQLIVTFGIRHVYDVEDANLLIGRATSQEMSLLEGKMSEKIGHKITIQNNNFSKVISRKHATLRWDARQRKYELTVLGEKGVWLIQKEAGRTKTTSLKNNEQSFVENGAIIEMPAGGTPLVKITVLY
ncbi:FHA domain-containing protein [Candidatus Woesearchaeota archaeon]|nr:FHA domain-containing protein [Candidatus Woesearchaeota archaeon]